MFSKLNKERVFLEEKYNIFSPYLKYFKLNKHWNFIIKKCLFLKQLNHQNKILLNKKFYLNQHFLELLTSHQKCITYNISGNVEI